MSAALMKPERTKHAYWSRRPAGRRAVGAAIGLLADRMLGEPPAAVHPVAGFGKVMGIVERTTYRDRQGVGMAYTAAGAAGGATLGALTRSTAVVSTVVVSGRMLRRCATDIGVLLEAGDIEGARAALPSLAGRDPSVLDASGIAAAVVESLADNTVDAVVAPACWAVIAGGAGAAGYRAINTMDAMVGHRSARYTRFGWASARLDDVAGFVPARLTALLIAVVCPARRREIGRTVRDDAPRHPSPNAGVAEAAFAAALGVALGGPLRYGERWEERPVLGTGPRPCSNDVMRAVALANRVELVLAGLLTAGGTALLLSDRSRA